MAKRNTEELAYSNTSIATNPAYKNISDDEQKNRSSESLRILSNTTECDDHQLPGEHLYADVRVQLQKKLL